MIRTIDTASVGGKQVRMSVAYWHRGKNSFWLHCGSGLL